MRHDEAKELLDQLHEVLDERFEAGPAPYVIDTMTAEPNGPHDWSVEVVYEPTPGAPKRGLRLAALDGRAPLEAAWEIYRRLESGDTGDTEPDERDVSWTAL